VPRKLLTAVLAFVAVALLAGSALAQSKNATPVMVVTSTSAPLDPASIAPSDDNKKIVTEYLDLVTL
jgi:hypothetical protein